MREWSSSLYNTTAVVNALMEQLRGEPDNATLLRSLGTFPYIKDASTLNINKSQQLFGLAVLVVFSLCKKKKLLKKTNILTPVMRIHIRCGQWIWIQAGLHGPQSQKRKTN